VNAVVIGGYALAAFLLRRRFKIDWRLRSIRDVMLLLLVALPAAGVVAALGALALVLDHVVPAGGYLNAALNWAIGDSVAISSFTPFLLVFVLPAVRRFGGLSDPSAGLEDPVSEASPNEAHGINRWLESLAFGIVILGALWVVLGPASPNHDEFYIFFLPIIWIAVRRGLRGATTWILLLDVGIVVSLRHFHGDASHFAVLQFLMLILSLTGLVLGSLISERDRTERRLSREEERIRLLLESVSEGVCGVDLHGNATFCNPAFLRLLGYPSQQALLGRNLHDVIHHTKPDGTHLPWAECPLHGSLVSGEKVHAPTVMLWKSDGNSLLAEQWASPIIRNGKVMGAVITTVDITKRLQAEESLHQAKESAEAANRAKSDFLANMSHELRTPMNGVLGMAALALDTDLSAEQREYIEMVKQSGDSLLALLNDILDLSKIEAGKLDLELTDFSVEDSIEEALAPIAPMAQQKSIELIWNTEGVPPLVRGDRVRLRQVLINLAGNALKFTSEGQVTVLAETSSAPGDPLRVHFSIADTGIGIPLEKQRQIFDAFAQADMSISRRFGGTGLGLSISERLVKLMNGRIWLDSEEGVGSVFHFELPFFSVTAVETAAASPVVSPAERRRILVADDNPINLALLKRLLNGWGFEPVVAYGGADALDTVLDHHSRGLKFSGALLDLDMPDHGGTQLAERISGGLSPAGQMVLMLSAPLDAEQAARCKRLGMATILKPIRRAALFELLTNSAPGRKSSFFSGVGSDASGSVPSGMHILLCEDNSVNQRLIARILEKMGHVVSIAGDGHVALHMLGQRHFDLIAMDMQMPHMDGIEATERIRAQERGTQNHIPIIAMTANAFEDDRRRCYEAGMDGYVTKPVSPQSIRDEISRVWTALDKTHPVPTPK
jgi:two-component system, sensor histidine kinase and response regulator